MASVNVIFTLVHVLGIAGLVAMLVHRPLREAFARRCLGALTARDLAFVRIVTCSVLLAYIYSEDLASQARLGPEWFQAPGYLARLQPLFDWLHGSTFRLQAFTCALVVAASLGLAGVATRVVLPLSVVLYTLFAALLRSFGKDFHEGYLVGYVLLALCFSPAGDAWSCDSVFRRWRQRRAPDSSPSAPPASYAWGVWSCYAAACIPYLQLSASKLGNGGWFWFEGRGMRNYLLVDSLNLVGANLSLGLRFYTAPTVLFTLMGFFGLLTELMYPLVLVFSRARIPLALAAIVLHLGVWAAQDALFLDAILMPLIFLGPSHWRRTA